MHGKIDMVWAMTVVHKLKLQYIKVSTFRHSNVLSLPFTLYGSSIQSLMFVNALSKGSDRFLHPAIINEIDGAMDSQPTSSKFCGDFLKSTDFFRKYQRTL